MSGANDAYARESAAALTDEGLASELLDSTEASRRWSQIDFSGITSVLFEPDAGFLFARRACQKVVEQFQREGGDYRVAKMPEPDVGGSLEADAIVYACGPWLPEMFPDVLGERIVPTRQPVHYFGTPAGDASFESPALPIWLELGERIMYGIPGDDQRGFKIADDTSGARVDPTTMSRTISEADLSDVRAYLARRFPGLADAPWIGGEVCQYESTPDAHFILDTHPHDASIWLVGGGSGHGFKMGPAIGEVVADAVLGRTAPDPTFSLTRFATQQIGTDAKWASSDSLRTK